MGVLPGLADEQEFEPELHVTHGVPDQPRAHDERAAGETLRPIFTKLSGQGVQGRTLKHQSVGLG